MSTRAVCGVEVIVYTLFSCSSLYTAPAVHVYTRARCFRQFSRFEKKTARPGPQNYNEKACTGERPSLCFIAFCRLYKYSIYIVIRARAIILLCITVFCRSRLSVHIHIRAHPLTRTNILYRYICT